MKVTVRIRRTVVIDNNIDSLNINTSTEDVCSYKNTFFESLKRRVTIDTVFIKTSVKLDKSLGEL